MSRINVKRVIRNSKFLATVSIQRGNAGEYDDDGVWQDCEDLDEPISIRASVQQTTSDQRRLLPEGVRDGEAVTLFTKTRLNFEDSGAGTVADQVLNLRGKNWVVSAVDDWSLYGYYYAVCTKLNPEVCS